MTPAAECRRGRFGCHVERRFSSQHHCGVDRSKRRVFQRLLGQTAGIHFRCETRFSLPGAGAFVANSVAWHPTFGIPAEAFVCFIENHDQIANTGPGDRLRFQTSPGRYRAMTALLLLGPWTPLLFQGEEFGASSPFLFFADVGNASVRDAIRKGRAQLLAPFLSLTEEQTSRSCTCAR